MRKGLIYKFHIVIALFVSACGVKVANTSYFYFDAHGNRSTFNFKQDSFEFVDFDGRVVVGIYQRNTRKSLLLTENMFINNKADMYVTEKLDSSLLDSIEFNIDVNGRNNLAHCYIYFISKQNDTLWRFCSPRLCLDKSLKDSINRGFYFVFPDNLSSNIYYPEYDKSNSFSIKFNLPKKRFFDTYFNNQKMILKQNYVQYNYKGIIATPYDIARLKKIKYRRIK